MIPGVDLAFIREGKEVQTEVVVFLEQLIEVVLYKRQIGYLCSLCNVETVDSLYDHL